MIRFRNKGKGPLSVNLLLPDGRFQSLHIKAKGVSDDKYPDESAERGEIVKLIRAGRVEVLSEAKTTRAASSSKPEPDKPKEVKKDAEADKKKSAKKEVDNG